MAMDDSSCSSSPPAAVRSRCSSTACRWRRSAPAGGSTSLAVHEYTLAGRNELTLVVGPAAPGATAPSQPRVAIGPTWARARLVLVRQGQSPADPEARVLGVAEWATPEGRSYDAPSTHKREVDLPVTFPRWRWLDAPPVDLNAAGPARHPRVPAAARGRARPRQSRAADRRVEAALRRAGARLSGRRRPSAVQRFRDHVQGLYAAKALKVCHRSPTSSCCGPWWTDG